MFLAAFPYFTHRFSASPSLVRTFPSAIISVSTVTNLVSMLLLTYLQSSAHYPSRIILSLILNIAVFTLLALSTVLFTGISPGVYFGFLMAMVFGASLATGLCQNGVFSYVSGFGEGGYTQGIMTGQGVAGVLPCIAQIVSVLSVSGTSKSSGSSTRRRNPDGAGQASPQESSKSAFAYFLTATAISAITLLAFGVLLGRHRPVQSHQQDPPPLYDEDGSPKIDSPTPEAEPLTISTNAPREPRPKPSIPYTRLLRLLPYPSVAVFVTFALTLAIFPTSTQSILSNHSPPLPRILRPESFIPLAFLCWNAADLLGRLLTAIKPCNHLPAQPKLLLSLALGRVIFVPLYYLCNRNGAGASISSDFFYLAIVQGGFGLTNGIVGSACMMSAGLVGNEDEEGEVVREAAGGGMGLMLVGGLTVGSLLSFLF